MSHTAACQVVERLKAGTTLPFGISGTLGSGEHRESDSVNIELPVLLSAELACRYGLNHFTASPCRPPSHRSGAPGARRRPGTVPGHGESAARLVRRSTA
jgi:hypothetical protein